MKRQDALSIGQIIDIAVAATGHRDDYLRQRLCFVWAEIVGPSINRMTTRRWVEQDTLHVCLTSSALKNELRFHTDALVRRLNEAVGADLITTITFH